MLKDVEICNEEVRLLNDSNRTTSFVTYHRTSIVSRDLLVGIAGRSF